jgi:isoamylase
VREIQSGYASPLGATVDEAGTNFALFSSNATRVELCLFDDEGRHEIARIVLPEKTHDVWHGYLPGVGVGQRYAYRVYGSYEPGSGHRFNHHKLVLDPYAKKLQGRFQWHESHFSYDHDNPTEGLAFDKQDNAPWMPKAVVTALSDRCGPGRHLVPWHRTVLYEAHVRGFTMRHPAVPEAQRGTFAGMGQSAVIDYLKALGVTSIELLPVHTHIDELFLHKKGLSNFWGYNSLSFFTAHSTYLAGDDILEFRRMVDRFHDAGLEVILDVVYNHSCEGNHLGPSLCYRGIDNAAYYHLLPGDKRFYVNDTGCGNTFNFRHPRVAQLVMDSLRYWAEEMGVDGFRFDLATIMGREESGFSRNATLFQMMAQDPILSTRKMIAEPWDLGPGGYQLGNFPVDWGQWNDRYRDTVRRFWRGDQGMMPELARRLHGSGDIFEHAGHKPYASVNYVTSHDGYTLRDLVSYEQRHNEGNQEENNDGHRENFSRNYGVEGDTDDAEVNALRRRQQRNFIATLLVSQGVPMLLAGDEIGRSQAGNNNAYCQDNAVNWLDWNRSSDAEALLEFTQTMLSLRRLCPVLEADRYRHKPGAVDIDGIQWLNGDGKLMREEHWHETHNRLLGYMLVEHPHGKTSARCLLLVIYNAHEEARNFALPACEFGRWRHLIDTVREEGGFDGIWIDCGEKVSLAPYSMRILAAGALPPELND